MAKASLVASVGSVAEEFVGAKLGDARLSRRLVAIGEKLATAPAQTFPKLMVTDAEQEAFYRFLRNEKVTLERLLQPHAAATVQRAAKRGVVLVLHDTTEFSFKGEVPRGELTELRSGTYGFAAHASLVVGADGSRDALGVAALTIHDTAQVDRNRWLQQALEVDAALTNADCAAIHVMDREADVYSLLATAIECEARFVVRALHDRLLAEVDEQERTLLLQLEHAEDVAVREVALSRRSAKGMGALPDQQKRHPPRNCRLAKLAFRATAVTLPRPRRQSKELAETVRVNVVHVREIDVPADVHPVEWTLITTEPISNREEILAVVDAYRTRWVIEEYFKALKTGCAYESRQLESLSTLTVALGLFAPIAWRLLLLRNLSRTDDVPAHAVITDVQLAVLIALCAQHRHTIPSEPTSRDVMLAVARLGGHIKNNGEPGWQVLWRGYQDLIAAEAGYRAAMDAIAKKSTINR